MLFSIIRQELNHSMLIVMGVLLMLVTNNFIWLPSLATVTFIVLLYINRQVLLSFSPIGGYANWVTIFRLTVLLLLGFFYATFDELWLGMVGLGVLCLDGLDGYLARKFNQTSDFGGRLDGETDAYFVLQFACLLFYLDVYEWWILWPGLLRYFYVFTSQLIWKSLLQEPASYFRKTIAVVIMSALLLPFVLGATYSLPVIIVAVIAVTISFAVSFAFQIRNNDKFRL